MKKLLVGLCTVGLLASSLVHAVEYEWTNKQGKTIKAGFVSAGEEAVTISMGGKSYVVKLADLSPESQALARKLGDQNSKLETKIPSDADHDPKTVTLGEFIKGKRIYLRADGEGNHSDKREMAMQFDKDGTIVLAIEVAKGEFIREVSAKSLHPTYKVDELRVAVLNDGKETTGIQFSSTNPKIGDKVSLGRDKGIISRIEKAGPFVFKEGGTEEDPAEGKTETVPQKVKPDAAGSRQETLAEFLPGKRIYFYFPEVDDSGTSAEPPKPEPAGGKPDTPPEAVWQFEKDGTITNGLVMDGEFFPGDNKMTYKVVGLEVVGEEGGMTFPSPNPQKGDEVLMGEKGQEKIPVTISRIEEAGPTASNALVNPRPKITKKEIFTNNVAELKRKLEAGADPNVIVIPNGGATALHRASNLGRVEIVRLLLAHGAKPNELNKGRKTPLDALLEPDHQGVPSLDRMTAGDQKAIRTLLVDAGGKLPKSLKLPAVPQKLSIHIAASRGDLAAIQAQLTAGADVNEKGKGHYTPLHLAARSNQWQVAELLISKGAKVNAFDNLGITPLEFTTGNYARNKKAREVLRRHGAKTAKELRVEATRIKGFIDEGDAEALKKDLADGADANARKNAGASLLHYAVKQGRKEIVELLITNGAEVNAGTSGTPLDSAKDNPEIADILRRHGGKTIVEHSIHAAAREGNVEAVKRHLASGADVNAKDENGETPLGHADRNKLAVAELLIANGADVNAKDKFGHPLLHSAAGNWEVAELLISNGAEVNAKDKYGKTPLHSAAGSGKWEVAELLISNGAEVNAKDKYGKTPLHDAGQTRGGGCREVVGLLIATGADVTAEDASGKTPLEAALQEAKDQPEIADLLRNGGAKTVPFARKFKEWKANPEPFGGCKALDEIRRNVNARGCHGITRLQLNGPGSTLHESSPHRLDHAIKNLTPLAWFRNLEDLNLGINQITDLTPLAGLTKLKNLSLGVNQITDLTSLAGLTKLEMLILSLNQIDDLTPLTGLTKLKVLHLNLNKTKITDEQKEMLKKALPNCRINF